MNLEIIIIFLTKYLPFLGQLYFLSFLQGNEFRSRHPPFAFFMQSEIIPTIVACCFSVCPTAQDVKKEY